MVLLMGSEKEASKEQGGMAFDSTKEAPPTQTTMTTVEETCSGKDVTAHAPVLPNTQSHVKQTTQCTCICVRACISVCSWELSLNDGMILSRKEPPYHCEHWPLLPFLLPSPPSLYSHICIDRGSGLLAGRAMGRRHLFPALSCP